MANKPRAAAFTLSFKVISFPFAERMLMLQGPVVSAAFPCMGRMECRASYSSTRSKCIEGKKIHCSDLKICCPTRV